MTFLERVFNSLRGSLRKRQKGGVSAGIIPEAIRKKAAALLGDQQGLLLDLGCGEGLFLKRLNSSGGIFPVGIDLSLLQVMEAKNKLAGKVPLVVADARKLPFKNNVFGHIIALNLTINIDSYSSLMEIFQEVKRVLKDKGDFIFDYRESKNIMNYLRFKFIKAYDRTVKYTRCYNLKDFQDFFKKESFKIEKFFSLSSGTAKLLLMRK